MLQYIDVGIYDFYDGHFISTSIGSNPNKINVKYRTKGMWALLFCEDEIQVSNINKGLKQYKDMYKVGDLANIVTTLFACGFHLSHMCVVKDVLYFQMSTKGQ